VLELTVQSIDGRERIDLVGALVGPESNDARESKCEARLVPVRALDDIEGDLDDDGGLDLPEPANRRTVWASNQRVISAISASVRPV